jgi:hypothetical protein
MLTYAHFVPRDVPENPTVTAMHDVMCVFVCVCVCVCVCDVYQPERIPDNSHLYADIC